MLLTTRKVRPTHVALSDLRTFYIANPICPSAEAPTLADAFRLVGRGKGTDWGSGTIFIVGGSVLMAPSTPLQHVDIRLVVLPPKSSPTSTVAKIVSGGSRENTPAIHIGDGAKFSARNVSFFHSCGGGNLWQGNSTFFVSGGALNLVECSVQSSTGRGIVSTKGGQVDLISVLIHDCAATGLYCGTPLSGVTMSKCNVVRNGLGGERGRGCDLRINTMCLTDSFFTPFFALQTI